MPVVQAVTITVARIWLPRAHDTERLVIRYVACETPHFVQWQIPVFQKSNVSSHVVIPTQPTTMGSIQVEGCICCDKLLQCVLDAVMV